MAGLGRGAPGIPVLRGARGSPGRSGPRAAGAPGTGCPGSGRRVRCIPWVDENGLLPGRGPLGLGTGARGTADCRVGSPGVEGGVDTGPGGAATEPPDSATGCGTAGEGAAGASTVSAGAAGAGAGTDGGVATTGGATTGGAWPLTVALPLGDSARAPVGSSVLTPSVPSGIPVDVEAAALAAFFAAAAAARAAFAAASAVHSGPFSSWSRRTTGASTVDDADLTNSPISLRASSTFLLGTPNSLASSWTLAFSATILLLGRSDPRRVRTSSWWACSSHDSHRDVMSRCSAFVSCLTARPRVRPTGVPRTMHAVR